MGRALRPGHETIVHAGREELLFCLRAIGRSPEPWFDVQIAAGLVGYEYPAGYANLLTRILGKTAKKGETRTDWARRPLTQQQIAYALDDVRYLEAVHDVLAGRLKKLQRTHWMEAEMSAWKQRVSQSLTNRPWRRVAGSASLSSRSLAIVRELWDWREERAEQQDKPPRRVLRDDLIVELARRRTADPKRIQAVRGFERRDFRQLVPELAQRIEKAMNLPDDECPKSQPRDTTTKRAMLGQFLTSALSSICGAAEISPGIVGNPSDVRDLIALRLNERPVSDPPPVLTTGWRAEVVGKTLDDLLQGKRSIRIADPKSDHPLSFESV